VLNTDNELSASDRVKEVKVKIPVHYHVRLHSMKVLTGKQISDAVTEALDAYFAIREPVFGRAPTIATVKPATDIRGLPELR